jgi:hypothetical protein
MKWFRSYHGAPMDPKWPAVAKRASVRISDVAAVWWCLMDYASQQEDRGSIEGFDPEIVAAFYQLDTSAVEAVINALEAKECLNGKRVSNWEEYQFEETSTKRVKRHRNGRETVKKRRETKRNRIPSESVSVSVSESGSSPESGKDGDDLLFEAWYSTYPRRQGRGQALKAFRAAMQKTDFDTLMAGIERYKAIKAPYADYCMPATWLNGERWKDEASASGVVQPPPKGTPKAFVPTDTDSQWPLRVKGFKSSGFWSTSWGPRPGEDGCQCPQKYLTASAA